MDGLHQPELQRRTLRLYGELVCRREHWGGQLVLAAFDGAGSSGLAAAASLAGAASLVADADKAGMKAHFRDGAFDFVVNTLDEALRAIKNEVRQARPIAIGLIAEPSGVIAEAVERGLAADVVLLGPDGDAARAVAAKGAVLLSGVPSTELRQWLRVKHWVQREVPVRDGASVQSPQDPFRQRWFRDLATHQRSSRQGPRWAWMSDE